MAAVCFCRSSKIISICCLPRYQNQPHHTLSETLAPACQHLLCRCLGSRCMEPHICTFKFNNSNFFSFLIPAVISYMIPEYPIFAFSVLQYLVNQYAKTLRSNNGYSVCLLNIPWLIHIVHVLMPKATTGEKHRITIMDLLLINIQLCT